MFGHKFASLSTQNPPQTIHQAVALKNVQAVVDLIKAGVDLDLQNKRGQTALHILAYLLSDEDSDSISITKLLLENGADPNRADSNGRTPLLIAARRKKPQMVEALLLAKKIKVDSFDYQGKTPLFHAVDYPNYFYEEEEYFEEHRGCHDKAEHIVKVLLFNGADPNWRDKDKNTPLHRLACTVPINIAIAKVLLDELADPNSRNEKGNTPLHFLLRGNLVVDSELDMAKLLLKKGADPNLQNQEGDTPLHIAALRKQFSMIDILLASEKMNVNLPDKFGNPPLFYALSYDDTAYIAKYIIKALSARGANLKHQNKEGNTILHLCICAGADLPIIEMLIEHGAEVNVQNKAGKTPLYMAVVMGNSEIVEHLLDGGADVNAECKKGYTPFYLAATGCVPHKLGNGPGYRPLFEMVKIFLDKKGDIIDWKGAGYREDLLKNVQDERIKELLTPIFQKVVMWDLWTLKEEGKYKSYFQWLPREMVEDIQSDFFSKEHTLKRKRTPEEKDGKSIKRLCQDEMNISYSP